MNAALWMLLLSAGPWPTLEQSFEGHPLAVFEVPDASDFIARVERSNFRRWVPGLMGEHAATVRESNMRVLGAWYGMLDKNRPDSIVAVDVQRQTDRVRKMVVDWWQKAGGKPVESRTRAGLQVVRLGHESQNVTVATQLEKHRVGWSMDARRAEKLAEGWSSSLASDEAFLAMVGAAPRQDVRAAVHVPRVFSWLLKRPEGPAMARLVGRLGLDGAQVGVVSGRLVHRREARLEGRGTITGPRRGVLAAVGPSVAAQWPNSVPGSASGFVAASVVPSAVLSALYAYLSADNPLQFALMQAQIASLERTVGNSLGDDILGATPRIWVGYRDRRGRWLGVIQLKSPGGLRAMIEALGAAYPSFGVRATTFAGKPVLEVGGRFVAFASGSVIVGESQDAVRGHLRAEVSRKTPEFLEPGPAFAFGQGTALLAELANASSYPALDTSDSAGFRLVQEGTEYRLHARLRR